jgi:hypothetical protein
VTKRPIPINCPYCDVAMRPTAMDCPVCGVEVRGRFGNTMFQMLSAEEQQLLEEYLLTDFSIKDLAARTGMGYAAIRSRLDNLIEHYRKLRTRETEKKRILERVAARDISAAEAARLIAELEGKDIG